MATPHILALCGSLRTGGFNKKLLDIAVAEARALGAEVDVVEPKSLGQLPLFDEDIEAKGLPPLVVHTASHNPSLDLVPIAERTSAPTAPSLNNAGRRIVGTSARSASRVAFALAGSPGRRSGVRPLRNLEPAELRSWDGVVSRRSAGGRDDSGFRSRPGPEPR